MIGSAARLEVSDVAEGLDAVIDEIMANGQQLVLTRAGVPVAILGPLEAARPRVPPLDWQQRFDTVVARIQAAVPAELSEDAVEAEIQAARDEVRRERRAGHV